MSLMAFSDGTLARFSGGGLASKQENPAAVRTWKVQTAALQGASISTDWLDTNASWAHDMKNGGTTLARTKELIEQGYYNANGELTAWWAGATSALSFPFGTAHKEQESYYAGKVLVLEMKHGIADSSFSFGFGTAPSGSFTLDRNLNVTEAGDGVEDTFTITAATGTAAGTTARQLRVYVDSGGGFVRLTHGTDYTVSDNGSNLDVIFATPPANGAVIRMYSIRKEFTLAGTPAINNNWQFQTNASSSAVITLPIRPSLYLKTDEDDLYETDLYYKINPGWRTWLDAWDVIRTMDCCSRIMYNDACSLSEISDANSCGWNAESSAYSNGSPWTVNTHNRKTGVPFDVFADYCENGSPTGHKKILHYHFPGWLCSPVRKTGLYNDTQFSHDGSLTRHWFSNAIIDISATAITTQPAYGSITLDNDEGWFEYDPHGTGTTGAMVVPQNQTSDGTTNPRILTGQAGALLQTVQVETGVGTNSYTTLTEGVGWTQANNAGNIEVTLASVPANGVRIRFSNPDTFVQWVASVYDRHTDSTKDFVIPLHIINVPDSGYAYTRIYGTGLWDAEAGAVVNLDWFEDHTRWRAQGEIFVDWLVASGYSTTRPLYLAVMNEIWNNASVFHADTQYCNGAAAAYGQIGTYGVTIILGFIRKAIEDELTSRALSYNLVWLAEAQAGNASTTSGRFDGHTYFWENIVGLDNSAAVAKNATLAPSIAMYVGGAFVNDAARNLPGEAGATGATEVLDLLAVSGETLETAYLDDWFRIVTAKLSNRKWNMDFIASHMSNAEARGAVLDPIFYEGWTHDDSGSTLPGLSSDDDFKNWFVEAMVNTLGATIWREMADAIIAEYPTATLACYAGPRTCSFDNPWGLGPWELAAGETFAAIRDEYGPLSE